MSSPSVSQVEPPHPSPRLEKGERDALAGSGNGSHDGSAGVPKHLYKRIPKHLLLADGTPNYLRMILTARVYDIIQPTPLTEATQLSTRLGCKISLKREDLQPVFSFKVRGAYNCIAQLSTEEKEKGVVACSAG